VRTSTIAAFVAVAALLVALVPVASAAPLSSAEGTPNDTDSSPTGYYIFHHDESFDMHTHGPGSQHDFDAVLRTGGTFDNVTVQHLENGDTADVRDGGHELVLHFHTFGATDGVSFVIHNGDKLRFNLKLDNQQIPTDEIFLGPQGRHPRHNPFALVL
jgi:opacity protein-like surface antigen